METSESFCCFSQSASVEFPPLSAGLEPQSGQRRQKIRSHMIGGLHVFTANWTIGELHLFVNMKAISFTHKSLLQEKAFETLNKKFFNDIRCRPLLFIVSVYLESFIFSLCDDLGTEERALSRIKTDRFCSCITHRHANRQQITLTRSETLQEDFEKLV